MAYGNRFVSENLRNKSFIGKPLCSFAMIVAQPLLAFGLSQYLFHTSDTFSSLRLTILPSVTYVMKQVVLIIRTKFSQP